MRPPEERLARLLERHPELQAVSGGSPTGAIIRRDQLLVPAAAVSRVESTVAHWLARRHDLADLGVARLTLRRGADVTELVSSTRSPDGRPLAAPVHLFRGEPHYEGGPADAPQPAPAPGDRVRPSRRRPPAARQHVAVLDTGLAAHRWFPKGSWTALSDPVDDILDENNDYFLDAQAGHGTFVAGVIRHHAPEADLLVGRVLGSDGVCDEIDLLRALRGLRAHARRTGTRIDVLNLSLGAYTWDDQPPEEVTRALVDLGPATVVVAAAGNAGQSRPFWPAACDPVVAVGSLDATGTRAATFSNHGPWVDAWAIGEGVTSSFVTFDGAKGQVAGVDPDEFTGYARWSGTSFAAPRVAAEIVARAAAEEAGPRTVLPGVLHDARLPGAGHPRVSAGRP